MNDTIKSISSKIKETALSIARHDDATKEINALLAMAECLEEIGAERNRPLTVDEARAEQNPVWFESRSGHRSINCWVLFCAIGNTEMHYMRETGFRLVADIYEYDQTWRVWKTQPTDSDRAAAKWDEAKD